MKNKDEIMDILNTIFRELTSMSAKDFEKSIKFGRFEIKFCRFSLEGNKKITTKIIVEEDDVKKPQDL